MSDASGRLIHPLVERWAVETPDAIALIDGTRRLTFLELDRLTNRLARKLLAVGISCDDVVGVFTGRCAAMVTSLLAINKAGGAYCPLDPSLPADRMAFMLTSSRARLVMTTRALWAASPIAETTPMFVDDPHLLDGVDDAPVDVAIDPQNLAYVIYTSGSTGRPKGIEMPHWLLVRLLAWHCPALPRARTAQYASFFFDVSFQDIYGSLAAGSTVILVPENLRVDFSELCRFLCNERVERIFLPVVALIELAEVVRMGAPLPSDLREVASAGEQLKVTPAIRELFDKLGPGARLYNHYGPAETHLTHSATFAAPASSWADLPHIGEVIGDVVAYLLDDNFTPVGDGTEGGLYIGVTVSRGYRGRPGITAERFLPDPFSKHPGARMYWTGDRAVRRPDGNYEFRGRADFQVKIRGFRVEPEEIETTLTAHAAVSAAVVVPVKDRSSSAATEQRLLAYIVLDREVARGDDEAVRQVMLDIRRFAQERLASYMMPAFFTAIDALPLTPSGKVDRRLLRERAQEVRIAPQLEPHKVSPRNATESTLAEIWQQVLDVESVGVTDDFFSLGGDSLRLTRLIAQVRDLLEVEPSLESFFNAPTIEGLHAAIQRDAEHGAEIETRADLVLRVAQMSDEEVAAALGPESEDEPRP